MPIAIDAPQQTAPLFDHIVGADNDLRWHSETECFGGLEVDDQLYLCGLLDRQVRWLFSLEYAASIDASQTVGICKAAILYAQRPPPSSR